MITNLKWNSENTLKVSLSSGEVKFCKWPNNGTWYAEYIQQAIDSGLVIEPKDPDPVPIDLGDIDNLDKVLKAIGLTIAEVSGRTPQQIKTIFRQKYEAL